MLIIIHSETNKSNIQQNLGRPEYSYYFVLKEFRPVLERLGQVIEVSNPDELVDRLYFDCLSRGEACVFLSFSPPHRTPIHYACPTIPVFAWEFSTIPTESWHGEPRHDWRVVLNACGMAITLPQPFARRNSPSTAGPCRRVPSRPSSESAHAPRPGGRARA